MKERRAEQKAVQKTEFNQMVKEEVAETKKRARKEDEPIPEMGSLSEKSVKRLKEEENLTLKI